MVSKYSLTAHNKKKKNTRKIWYLCLFHLIFSVSFWFCSCCWNML